MNSFELTVLGTDYDGLLELGLRASSEVHATYHEVYAYPATLTAFADDLKNFPSNVRSEVVVEFGSRDPHFHNYVRLRVFCLNPSGHSALEIESEARGAPPVCAECHFFIPGMPADFNRLGTMLAAWMEDPRIPMRAEWRGIR